MNSDACSGIHFFTSVILVHHFKMSTTLDYKLLWTQESQVGADIDFVAEKIAQTWPSFPSDPTRPVERSVKIDVNKFPFPTPVLPVKSTRKRRNRGYANLSNYNSIP